MHPEDQNDVMSGYAAEAHRVRERIASAPVEKWLKIEAMNDLDQLTAAAAHDLALVHAQYQNEPTAEEYNAQFAPVVEEPVESDWREDEVKDVELGRPVAGQWMPSDYEMRNIAIHASNGSSVVAREFYQFLKEANDAR